MTTTLFATAPVHRLTLAILQSARGYPSVSVLMPLDDAEPAARARLAGLVRDAERRLLQEFEHADVADLLEGLRVQAEVVDLHGSGGSVALFASASLLRSMRLPVHVRRRVVIDTTFATRDLVHALNRSVPYRVVVLGERRTRLFEGVGHAVEEVVGGGFPLVREPRDQPRSSATEGHDARTARLTAYVRELDDALTPHASHDGDPLFAIGDTRRVEHLARTSRLRARIAGRVAAGLEHHPREAVARAVAPLVDDLLAADQRRAFDELETSTGAGQVASGMHAVWRAAVLGRGSLLLAERGFEYPGHVDAHSPLLRAADDAEAPGVVDDVVDEAIELVLQRGGRAHIVEDGTLASHGRIAMVLRH